MGCGVFTVYCGFEVFSGSLIEPTCFRGLSRLVWRGGSRPDSIAASGTQWPMQLEDCEAALKWLQDEAKFFGILMEHHVLFPACFMRIILAECVT